jgi:transposase-like protein
MTTRRFHSPADKVALLRRHLLEHVPVSDLCDEAGIAPSLFYLWQREFFENGQAAFTKANGRHAKKADEAKDQKIKALEAKLQRKDAVLGEIMEEHVALKKELGEI